VADGSPVGFSQLGWKLAGLGADASGLQAQPQQMSLLAAVPTQPAAAGPAGQWRAAPLSSTAAAAAAAGGGVAAAAGPAKRSG